VLAYVLWRQLRPRNPLIADLSTMAAATRWQAAWAPAVLAMVAPAVLAMVAPMLMHGYTDATAAGQALIAAEFAINAAGGVACHLAIPGRHPAGSSVARNRVAPPRRWLVPDSSER
jgi:hypothetical protein